MQPVPPTIEPEAHAHGLGTFRESFQPPRLMGFLVIYSVFAAVMLILTLVFLFSGGDPRGWLAVVAITGSIFLVMVGILAWAMMHSPVTSAAARARQIHAFDQGWIHVTKAGVIGRRWDSVATVRQEIVERRVNGISVGTNYTYRLTFVDGSSAKLTNTSTDLSKFGPVLMREVARAQLPRAGAALHAGQVLHFGDFAISQQGIAVGGKAMAPWTAVKRVDMAAGQVRVYQEGKLLPSTRAASSVPNLYTFLMLVDQLTGVRA